MFPSQGYFWKNQCPVGNECQRPYCFFSHKGLLKKNAETPKSSTDISNYEKSNSEKLKAVVVAAVEKAISQEPNIGLKCEDIINKIDANAILSNVLQQSCQTTEVVAPVKKKKLYLPPPGTPKYQPTPICELKNQAGQFSSNSVHDEEYTPTCIKVTSTEAAEESETTDFSSDAEDNSNDFDILDEVFTEHSSDPVRKKAIQKRKKALGKLSSKRQISNSTASNNKNDSPAKKTEVVSREVAISPIRSSDNYDNFLPPSPVFTSSSSTSVQELLSRIDVPVSNTEDESSNQDDIDQATANAIPPPVKHNILPNIVELSRPNVKSWSPIAKVSPMKDLRAVEKMLEAFDSIHPVETLETASRIQSCRSVDLPVKNGESISAESLSNKRDRPPDFDSSENLKKLKDDRHIDLISDEHLQTDKLAHKNSSSFNENSIQNKPESELLRLELLNNLEKSSTVTKSSKSSSEHSTKTIENTPIIKDQSKKTESNSKDKDKSSKTSRHTSTRSSGSSSRSHRHESRSHNSNRSSSSSSRHRNSESRSHSSRSSSSRSKVSSNSSSSKYRESSSKKPSSKSHENASSDSSCRSLSKEIKHSSSNHKRKHESSSRYNNDKPKVSHSKSSSKSTKEDKDQHRSKDKPRSSDDCKSKYRTISNRQSCDSPIPDLSALDELPKEDWDKLLANDLDDEDSQSISVSDDGVDPQMISISEDDEDVDANDPEVLDECRKMFSEYNPPEESTVVNNKKEVVKQSSKDDETVHIPVRKVRIAHPHQPGNHPLRQNSVKALVKPLRKTPTEVMMERYKKLKEEELALQKKLALQRKELAKHVKDPLLVETLSSPSHSNSLSSSTPIQTTSSLIGQPKKRIARAPSNVAAMLKSKESLKQRQTTKSFRSNISASKVEHQKALPTTHAKGTKRVAHRPNLELLEKPTICIDPSSKVPQNVRQRYLNCFIDECLKFCDSQSQAYKVAVAEEKNCHERSSSRMVYLNLAVNTVKRLRTATISDAAQDLLDKDSEYVGISNDGSNNNASTVKKFSHPINPNHHTVSHFSILASGGQKGTWSIEKAKKVTPSKENFIGAKFYNLLKKYILSEEQLGENGFPLLDPDVKGKAILKHINTRKKISPSEISRYCARCSKLYEVDEFGVPILMKSCVYHWGRPHKQRGACGLETKYSCCQDDTQSEGCCLATTHVSDNFRPHHLKGYVKTMSKERSHDENHGVYALDCEMCYTTAGNELARITVIDSNNKTVYETMVLPDNPIIDYNSRFSGITAEDMEGVKVSIRDVQAALLTRFSKQTILIGHSLESDFSALKLIHETVVDTSVVFPHRLGPPFKRALRNLASEYLKKIIQNDVAGHDSAEDALVCMELMKWKVMDDLKVQSC